MDRVVLIWWAMGVMVTGSAVLGLITDLREEGRVTAKVVLLTAALLMIGASIWVAPDMLDGDLTPATSQGELGLAMMLGIAGITTTFAGFRSAVGRRLKRFERERKQSGGGENRRAP